MIRIAIVLGLLFSIAPIASAQESLEHNSPFAHGAGRTYSVSSRGLDAVGLNPSLLALGTPRPWEISLIPISSFGVNAGPSFAQINSIASGFMDSALVSQTMTVDSITRGDSIRVAVTDLLGNNKLSSSANARLFGLSYYNPDLGAFAFTWTMHAAIRTSLPDPLLNYIGLNFFSRLFQQFPLSPQKLDLQGQWYGEYTLSYARNLLGEPRSGDVQLLGGAGLKYINGIAYMRMDPNSTFAINDPAPPGGYDRLVVNYRINFAYPDVFTPNHLPDGFSTNLITSTSAGSGIGGDVGITLGMFDSLQRSPWQFALSISDIGSITWTKNTFVRTAHDTVDVYIGGLSQDTINSKIRAVGGNLDTSGAAFTTLLPTTAHIGAALDLSEIGLSLAGTNLIAAAEYAIGLTTVVGAPQHGRLGFAAILDHPSNWLSFHGALGYTTEDGASDLTVAAGIGIMNRVLVDAGTAGLTSLFKKDGHSDVVFGLKVLF